MWYFQLQPLMKPSSTQQQQQQQQQHQQHNGLYLRPGGGTGQLHHPKLCPKNSSNSSKSLTYQNQGCQTEASHGHHLRIRDRILSDNSAAANNATAAKKKKLRQTVSLNVVQAGDDEEPSGDSIGGGGGAKKARKNFSLKNAATLRRQQSSRKDKKHVSLEAKRERKAAKTLAIVTGAFIACWLPFFILALMMPIFKDWAFNPHLVSFFLWLGYFNSTLNPIIYTVFSPEFRQAFQRILFGKVASQNHRPRHLQ